MCVVACLQNAKARFGWARERRRDDARIVSIAAVRAARIVGLTNPELARVIKCSISELRGVRTGRKVLRAIAFDRAIKLIRVLERLSVISNGQDSVMRSWVHAKNVLFNEKPVELMIRMSGLDLVESFLDRFMFRTPPRLRRETAGRIQRSHNRARKPMRRQ